LLAADAAENRIVATTMQRMPRGTSSLRWAVLLPVPLPVPLPLPELRSMPSAVAPLCRFSTARSSVPQTAFSFAP